MNPTKRAYRNDMIEILANSVRFETKNQKLDDQTIMILKKNWFSHLKIHEIC